MALTLHTQKKNALASLVFFCFAKLALAQSPGGVTGSAIWLKANTGVTTGATFTWADQSGNNRSGTQSTAGNQPTLTATSINYNPAVTFDGTNDRLNLANLSGLPTGASAVEGFAVARNLNTAGGWMHIISYGGAGGNTFFTLGKQQATANAVCAFNGSDAISSALEYANGTPALTNGKYTGTQGIIYSSGVQRGTINFTAVKATTSGRVGCDPVDAAFWNGNVAEAIIFPSNLSASNVLKVNSYLALKYGITLDQTTATNYVASDWNGTTGTIFWNGTTNSGNKNNIAGIGRDDNSALNQKQSKSVNTTSSGDLVAMGLGAIATNNAGNSNTFSADKSFLVWGDNGGANAWQTTESPSVLRKRLTREWKVQETGTVGNVEIQVQDDGASSGGELPAETGTVYLLVDADGDFSSGATEHAMTLTGTNWEVTVDLADGQYFTFATQVLPSPGGVATNTLWLKADAGTGTTTEGGAITSWADQSGNSNNATTTTNSGFTAPTSAGATFRSASGSNGMNFNPTVDFSTNKSLDGTGGLSTRSVFFVFNLRTTATTVAVVGYDDATPGGAGGAAQGYGRFNATNVAHGAKNNLVGNHLIGATQNYTISNTTPTIFDGQHVSNSSINLLLNGIGTSTITTLGTPPSPYTGSYRLGATSDNQYQYGSILPEVISFNANLTTSERLRVSSYLAIKWGITLGTTASVSDYQNSAGTTIWTGSATYQNNIAGIGRDDLSALNQKQSCSINTASSGDLVAMGLGTISTDNASNSNTFSADRSYLIWGDNAGANAWQATEAPASRQRLTREWKVQETGTVGNVLVRVQDDGASSGAELPAEVTTVYILVDADGDFSSGATEYAMTLASNYWTATVDFTSGQFFTFATQTPPAPGGVVSNLTLWLKPDAGTLNGGSPATNGQTVTTWQDQTTSANHFTTASAEGVITGAPTWAEVATNFNPALAFNGTQGLHRTSNLYTNNSNLSIFNVHRNANSAGTVVFTNNSGDLPNPLHMTWGYNQWTTTSSQFSVTAGGSTKTNIYGLTRLNTSGSNYTVKAFFEGKETGAVAVALNFAANNNKTTIGYRSYTDASLRNPHTDQINEVIVYTAELTATEQQKVNTYLALKYGTTLDQTTAYNYLASDGSTVFWNGTSNSGYKNNIAGIARDDASTLNQKQSQSVNTSSSGDLVTIGLGTIATSNSGNSNTFSADKSALVWGDNAGATTISNPISGSPISRMARIWKVQETGTVGTVKIRIPTSAITLGTGETAYLLKSTDATFTNTDPTFPLTVNGSYYETTLDFTSGDYFTFGKNLDEDVTLALTMTGSPASVTTGQNITYTLTLTNSGTSTATTVKVKDQLPGGVTFVSATPSTGTYNSATGVWTIPSIAPGSQTLTIVVTAQ